MTGHSWGPTSPTTPGAMERGATTLATNRVPTWSCLHHHRHASNKQGPDVELSPSPSALQRGSISITIYETSRTRLQEEEGGRVSRLSRAARPRGCLLLYLSLMYPGSFSWHIKGKVGCTWGDGSFSIIRKHFNSTSLSPETWELVPLSILYNPYYRPKRK
jgi:hypothetical protein